MDFDGHTSSLVQAAVALVNALTPGWARGREWRPEDTDRLAVTDRALAKHSRRAVRADEIDQFAAYAHALRTVFEHVDRDETDSACEHVNSLLQQTAAVPVLTKHDDEPWHMHFHAPDAPLPQAFAAAMSTALGIVLGSDFADRLGVCSAGSCDRAYVDTSRNDTRRFCSTTCQNRVKTAAFRQRRSTAP